MHHFSDAAICFIKYLLLTLFLRRFKSILWNSHIFSEEKIVSGSISRGFRSPPLPCIPITTGVKGHKVSLHVSEGQKTLKLYHLATRKAPNNSEVNL